MDMAIRLLESAGVTINGPASWDIQVHNNELYSRTLREGSLGFGEAYMDKWWDCDQLDAFFERIFRANLESKIKIPLRLYFKYFLTHLVNFQTKQRSKKVAKQHYDLGNTLFTLMLDKRMNYSCGYWKNATTLDQAQEAKLDLICRKLNLSAGMHLLDIGCGWGGLVKYAAEKYGVKATGVTISKEQHDYAREICRGLPIEIRLQDYRDINNQYDRVVSVGMFEHVGHLNYRNFMQVADRALVDNGLFLLHTIGSNITVPTTDEWISKYIFPNSKLPSIVEIAKAAEKHFIMEDWHNFGADYDKTLMAWSENFNHHWPTLKNQYDERFRRMWNYYLSCSAASFRTRRIQLWQIVFSKKGVAGGYIAPR